MGYAVSMLRAGRTYDYEDSRATSRLHAAYAALKAIGVEPERTHSDKVGFSWERRGWLVPEHHSVVCGESAGCKVTWPEWVTDEMLEAAYSLADNVLYEQGRYNRAAATRLLR